MGNRRTGILGRRAESEAFRFLRDRGFKLVARNFRTRGGEIDLYPEYTGTGWSVLHARSERISDRLHTFVQVQRLSRDEFDLEWLAPLGPNNTYAIAVRAELAERLGLERLSDLAAHGPALSGGFSLEFLNREDGWNGLAEFYGIELGEEPQSFLGKGQAYGILWRAADPRRGREHDSTGCLDRLGQLR